MQQPNIYREAKEDEKGQSQDGEFEQNEYFDCDYNLLTTEMDFHINDEILMLSRNTKKAILKFAEEILKYKQLSNQVLHNVIDLIQEYISKLKYGIKQLKRESCDYVKNQKNSDNLQKINEQIKDKLTRFLEEQQINKEFDQLFEILKNKNTQTDQNIFKKEHKRKYLIISKIKNIGASSIFEFNSSETILFVQTAGNIKLFGFNSRHKLIKTLAIYANYVHQLIWMKKQELLLLISHHRLEVIIWSNQWIPNQIFQSSEYGMNCIIMNEKEDIIIGSDTNIQFWPKSNLYKSCSQTIDTLVPISDLSLNPEQKRLLAWGKESEKRNNHQYHQFYLIYLIEMQDLQWVVTQIIRFLHFSDGLLFFTNNNQFVFQNLYQGFLQIFNYKHEKKKFIRAKPVYFSNKLANFNNHIQPKYIKQISVLIVSYKKSIYFFHIDQIGECELLKSVEFGFDIPVYQVCNNCQNVVIYFEDGIQVIRLRNIE